MLKRIFVFLTVLCTMTVSVSALDAGDVSAECAVLINEQTGEVLFEKNAYSGHSMASTTKIMTSLLAAESGKLHDEITVEKAMINVEGTSMGLLDGDSVSLYELIYGMLLSSGNDAANVTACYLGGNVENFASMMNQKAAELGMKNTHFVTPSGLDDDEHYSTAYDMALLGRNAVKNPVFRAACSSKKAVLTYGNPPYRRTLYNHNRLLSSYKYALGIKTGFTKKSGRCLVSYAENDGVGLVAVTLNAPNDWSDHRKMLDFGFSAVEKTEITAKIPQKLNVVGGNVENVGIKSKPFAFSGVDKNKVTQKISLERFLYAPVNKGDKVGEVKFYFNGECIGTSDIVAETAASVQNSDTKQEKKGFLERVKERLFND